MAVHVRPATTRRDTEAFIRFTWDVYRDDAHWVPPLLFDRRKILDTEKNPFYQHASRELFLAERDGRIVGRIAAIVNRRHNEVHADSTGFFGFFECIDDQEVAQALFASAGAWLRERGLTVMRGPMNPSINDDLGLLIAGFDSAPFMLMPHNPPYYQALIEGCGLHKAKDLYAYILQNRDMPLDRLRKGREIVQKRYGISVRDLNFKDIPGEVRILKELYNVAWEKNWGAVAMTDAEFDALAKDLVQVLGRRFRRFTFLVEKGGQPIGFALFLPDINQILIRNRGGRTLPGIWRLLTQTKTITRGRIIVLGILPEYRGKGIDAMMYLEVIERAAAVGVMEGEASWILEDNVMMNHGLQQLNAVPYKTYRIFDAAL